MIKTKKTLMVGVVGILAVGIAVIGFASNTTLAAASDQISVDVQQIADAENKKSECHGRRPHRRMVGKPIAQELGIPKEVYRQAVRTVSEQRQGNERPRLRVLTSAERLELRASFITQLAGELSIPVSDLETSFRTAFEARLDNALAKNKIVRADADERIAAYQAGTLYEVRRERMVEGSSNKLEWMLTNGVIDDAAHQVLQAELAEGNFSGFRQLMCELREGKDLTENKHRKGQ